MQSPIPNNSQRLAKLSQQYQRRADADRQFKIDFAECLRYRSNLPRKDRQFLEGIDPNASMSSRQERWFYDIRSRIDDMLIAAQDARPMPTVRRQITPARSLVIASADNAEKLRMALIRRRFGLANSLARAIADLRWNSVSERERA